MTLFQKFKSSGTAPLLFLLVVALIMTVLLVLRGLNLGFWGDLLAYEYHYQTLGIRGGMNWLVMGHWGRHFLGALYSAPIHRLFPGNSTAWYLAAFLTHFATGIAFFLFSDTLLRRRMRWLSMASALIFFFSTTESWASFEFPTLAARNGATILTFLSLWAYIRYLRSKARFWYGVSLFSFVISVMSYEQNALLFVVYPVLAYFEDRPVGLRVWLRWLGQVLGDLVIYAGFVVIYLIILLEIIPTESNFSSSISYFFRQILEGLNVLLNPLAMWSRALPAFEGSALLITLMLAIGVFALIAAWVLRDRSAESVDDGVKVILVGGAIIFANLVSVAPTIFPTQDSLRLLYLAVGGTALLLLGVLHLLIRSRMVKAIAVAGLVAFLVAPGITEIFQFQQQYDARNVQRQAVLNAVAAVVKLRPGAEKPYILLVTEADPDSQLSLYAQDINFPFMMDMALHTVGLSADVLYFDVPESLKPAPSQSSRSYIGRFIVADTDGIYSSVRPGTPIDPARLVLVSYDATRQSARILDVLPPDILSHANIVQRASIPWRTNFDLLQNSS
jgi:hypothetical protein